MWNQFKIKFGTWLARDYIRTLESAVSDAQKAAQEADFSANRRYAQLVAGIDPLDLVLRDFNGIFSKEFTNPEEKFDQGSRLRFLMWAYQQYTDPSFNYMIDWIMNSAGNETMKRAPVSNERTLYGRAQISNMVLFRKEVGRLSSLYEDELEKQKGEDFDPGVTVD